MWYDKKIHTFLIILKNHTSHQNKKIAALGRKFLPSENQTLIFSMWNYIYYYQTGTKVKNSIKPTNLTTPKFFTLNLQCSKLEQKKRFLTAWVLSKSFRVLAPNIRKLGLFSLTGITSILLVFFVQKLLLSSSISNMVWNKNLLQVRYFGYVTL